MGQRNAGGEEKKNLADVKIMYKRSIAPPNYNTIRVSLNRDTDRQLVGTNP